MARSLRLIWCWPESPRIWSICRPSHQGGKRERRTALSGAGLSSHDAHSRQLSRSHIHLLRRIETLLRTSLIAYGIGRCLSFHAETADLIGSRVNFQAAAFGTSDIKMLYSFHRRWRLSDMSAEFAVILSRVASCWMKWPVMFRNHEYYEWTQLQQWESFRSSLCELHQPYL